MTDTTTTPSLDEFVATAREWLAANAELRPDRVERTWGEGSDSVAVFHNTTFEEDKAIVDAARAWQQRKSDAGYASIDWAPEFGGGGLPSEYARAFSREEGRYDTPTWHEALGITLELIGPTIRAWGTPEQTGRFLTKLRRTDEMWCQLFSEPGAGSDLARLSTKAVRDGDEWIIDGQKVWTSGARHADYGYIICRTDPDVAQARRAHGVHRADARAGRRRAAAAADERRCLVQRGVLRRCARRRRPAPRRGGRRLAGGDDHAGLRARLGRRRWRDGQVEPGAGARPAPRAEHRPGDPPGARRPVHPV